MENLESVELDCLNKSKSYQTENEEKTHSEKKNWENKSDENESNATEEKSTMRNLFESFNINGLVGTLNYEESEKKNSRKNKEQRKNIFLEEGEKYDNTTSSYKSPARINYTDKNNTDDNLQKYNIKETSYKTVLEGKEEKETDKLFNSTLIDLDNETANLEEWNETQKKIYDPTIELRKHYTSEFLSCGEKNDVRILEKWSSMINRDILWFIKQHKTTYLRRLKRGIPQKYRWKIWVQITNARPLISKFQKKYYYLSKQKSTYTNLILIDISRTFPELLIFDKYAQQQLYRILNAYSNLEPAVGYCQGMNFVVGLLLLVSNFDELETFCVLVSLMNNYHLKEFYKDKFPLLNKYIYVFEKILLSEIPDLVEHFNKEEVLPPVYLHQWMLTLFIASLPIKSVLVIWDFLFSTSIKMIIFISVALLKILKTYLMKHKFEKILKLLKSLKYNESNDDILIAKLLIKKSDAIELNEELKFLFENIEQENILFNYECKYAIENITNSHFINMQDNKNNEDIRNQKNIEDIHKGARNESECNFVQLDGVPLLNYFTNNLLKKNNEEELKYASKLKHSSMDIHDNLKADGKEKESFGSSNQSGYMNTLYHTIISGNENENESENENENENQKKKQNGREKKKGAGMEGNRWREEERRKTQSYHDQHHNGDTNTSKNSSGSGHFFFRRHSTDNDTKTRNEDTHNKVNLTERLANIKHYKSGSNDSRSKERSNSKNKAYTDESIKDCADEFFATSTEQQEHIKDTTKSPHRSKKWKETKEKANFSLHDDLNYCSYISDNSCSSRNASKGRRYLTTDDLVDHLYKSDSFVEACQKSYKSKTYGDTSRNVPDDSNRESDKTKYSHPTHFNIFHEGNKENKLYVENIPPTSKPLTVNIETKQRKSDGHIKRHAYYNSSSYKEDTYAEDERSEHLIKYKMNVYEKKINAIEKKEKGKRQDLENKIKKQREERERERERQRQKEKKKNEDDDENVLNISHYIQSNENEQKDSDTNFGFFNILQSYTKDNNWFDVSTINKYYQFNKNNMDYELDDINYNHNKNNGKNSKREDDESSF